LAAPFRIVSYLHYRIYDLTDMSFRAWFKVLALRFPVPLLLFVLMGVLVYCILQLFKRRWWIVAAALVFLTFKVAPELTRVRPADPEKELRPLQDADYRTGLSRVARTAGITLDLLVEDRSNREKTVSAYLGGRASNRYFALTDTFLAKFTPQEAGAALAHELGHKRHEMPYLLASKALTLLRLTLAFGLAFLLTRQTGDRETHPLQVVVVAVLCLSLAGDLFLPADRAVSRWDERFADRYALELTGDPDTYASLLLKGSKLNLERWESPAWEYYLFAGYPSVRDRVAEALRHGHGH
jgi:STE24 endopeptidase